MARGLLIASFDFSDAPEDEFNDWYDLEHIPERKMSQGLTYANDGLELITPDNPLPHTIWALWRF